MSLLLKLKTSSSMSPNSPSASVGPAQVPLVPIQNKRISGKTPFPRRGFSASLVNNKDIFIIGGVECQVAGLKPTKECICHVSVLGTSGLAGFTNPVGTMGSSPAARTDHAVALVGKKLYLFGGIGDRLAFDDGFYILNTETKAWSRPRLQGEVPIRRRGHTAVSIGTKIYIFGGILDEGVYMNELIILDTDTMRCHIHVLSGEDARSPQPRAFHSAVEYGDKMVVYGGDNGYECLDDLWVLDTSSNPADVPRWTQINSGQAPDGAYQHAAVQVGDIMYVCGGKDHRGQSMNELFGFDFTTKSWTFVGRLPSAFSDHVICATKDKLYLLGGHQAHENDFQAVATLELKALKAFRALSPISPPPSPGTGLKISACSASSRRSVISPVSPVDHALSASLNSAKEDARSLRAELDRLQDEKSKLAEELDRVRLSAKVFEEKLTSAEMSARAKVDQFNAQLFEKERAIRVLEEQTFELKKSMSDKPNVDPALVSQLQTEIATMKVGLAASNSRCSELKQSLLAAEAEINHLKHAVPEMPTCPLKIIEDQTQHYKNVARENEELRAEITKLNAQIGNFSDELDIKSQTIERCTSEFKQKLDIALADRDRLSSDVNQLQADLSRERSKNMTMVSDLLDKYQSVTEQKRQIELQLATLHQKIASNEVCKLEENETTNNSLRLAEEQNVQLRQKMEDLEVEWASERADLLKQLWAFEGKHQTLEEAKQLLDTKVARLEEQLNNQDLTNDEQIKRHQAELDQLRVQMSNKDLSLSRIQTERDQLESLFASLKQCHATELANLQSELNSLKSQNAGMEREREQLKKSLDAKVKENDQILADFQLVRRSLEKAQASKPNNAAAESEWQRKLDQQGSQIRQLESNLAKAQSELSAAVERDSQSKERIFALTQALSKVAQHHSPPQSPNPLRRSDSTRSRGSEVATGAPSKMAAPAAPPPPPISGGVAQAPQAPPSPPFAAAGGPTPPPPPPIVAAGGPAPPPPPPVLSSASALPELAPKEASARNNLLSEIQAGKKLRKTPPVNTSNSGTAPGKGTSAPSPKLPQDPMARMMAEMAAKKLKGANAPAAKKPAGGPSVDAELAKKLGSRRF